MATLTPDDLVELEAIKRVKYAYLRCVDLKLWDELAELLTEDATASYGGGAIELDGRTAILDFLRQSLSSETMLTSHRCTQPEIEVMGSTAVGTWALDDTVIMVDFELTVRGAAFYTDDYVKVDGDWKIARTTYKRVYEEIQSRSDVPGLRLTASWWDTNGRSELI